MPASLSQPPAFIGLLAHDLRWSMLRALTVSDLRVNELVELVDQPVNLVSYHLKKLRADDLVIARRSEADGRDVYYSLNLDRLREQFRAAGLALHPSLVGDWPSPSPQAEPLRVLFVCTHNSARSQMAEALLRHESQGRTTALSAGSQPATIHPEAIRTMARLGIDISGQTAKPLETFAGQSFDYVITVCDMAREVCPTFPGASRALHWGFYDPATIADPDERARAFEQTAQRLRSRIRYFLASRVAPDTQPASTDTETHTQ